MKRAVLSPRAQADIEDIWDYTARLWDADQAERYVSDLRRAIELVAADPRCGTKCDDIRAGYFKYLAGSHVLFFKSTRNGIDIVRILHASMDFGQHL